MICPDFSFSSPALTHRRLRATVRNEALARAAGLKHGFRPTILDATAGLGQDSFILAALGCEVWLFERCPDVYALLNSGLQQAEKTTLAPIIARMHLLAMDALEGLEHPPIQPDVIYLDPMFPTKTKSAAVRKEMQFLQRVAGTDPDADQLLIKALCCATQRVVIKRPRLSPWLGGLPPDFSLKGTSSRFDVHLRRKPHDHTAHTFKPDPSS